MVALQDLATRDRILVASSRLFARRGYYGTSTRDIADAVGVRQPSIFYHFPSKSAILSELIDADVHSSIREMERVREMPIDRASKLHLFLTRDTANFLAQTFDARGLYSEAVFVEPEFEGQRALISRLHAMTRSLIDDGVLSGEFVAPDVTFVQRAATGIIFEVMRERGAHPAADSSRPLQVADFVLAAILTSRDRLAAIHAATIANISLSQQVPID